jgi:hypothetical protein
VRRLPDEDIETIARWVDAGAPEGDPQNLPPPLEFPDGWALGQPDTILEPAVDYSPDPQGSDIYRCFTMPTNFTEDRWVSAVEIRPGNRAIVHHVLVFIDRTGVSVQLDEADPGPGYTCFGGPGFLPSGGLGGWAPGARPQVLPDGVGWLVPAGAHVVMQVHYRPNGNPETDRTKIGLHFATKPVSKRFYSLPVLNRDFAIPPGDEHYRVTRRLEIPSGVDVTALSIAPHMHLLGREMEVKATLPDGQTKCLIYINDWDFNWQGSYFFKEPVPLPGGTVINLTAYYDNSDNNPWNPNSPPQTVTWGERTVDEMCIAFIGFTLDAEQLTGGGPSLARRSKAAEKFLKEIESEQCPCCRGKKARVIGVRVNDSARLNQ